MERRLDGKQIRQFIIAHVARHPADIVRVAAEKFEVSRQAVHKHIKKLIADDVLVAEGGTKGARYALKEKRYEFQLVISPDLHEDEVWREKVLPLLPELKENVHEICSYVFSEMLNNVIVHSDTDSALVGVRYDALSVAFEIIDYGVGIFNKLQKQFDLEDPRYGILELAKGKLTTDPERHTGEGIYFSARMSDDFVIMSEQLFFKSQRGEHWLLNAATRKEKGTFVGVTVRRDSTLSRKKVFDKCTLPEQEEYGFVRTKVPVKLLEVEGELLVSRSQAKRLLARFDRFKEIILDFTDIKSIGQGFADEIFRVFPAEHPDIKISAINVTEDIVKMIKHVSEPVKG